MKIRTDFVTNSSSSSFSVSIVVETEEKEYRAEFGPDFEPYPDEGYANLKCSAKDILNTGSVGDLARLLKSSVTGGDEGEYEELIAPLADSIVAEIPDLRKIKTIRLTRYWKAWGEAASCYFAAPEDYLEDLCELAERVCKLEGAEKEKAINAMEKYLKETTAEVCGAWDDEWPTGFMGSKGVARYKWDGSIEELAKLIVEGGLSGNDDAEETTIIDMQKKTVEHTATYKIKR